MLNVMMVCFAMVQIVVSMEIAFIVEIHALKQLVTAAMNSLTAVWNLPTPLATTICFAMVWTPAMAKEVAHTAVILVYHSVSIV